AGEASLVPVRVYLGRLFAEINQPVVLRLSQQTFVRLQVFRAIADARRMPSRSDRPGNNEPATSPGRGLQSDASLKAAPRNARNCCESQPNAVRQSTQIPGACDRWPRWRSLAACLYPAGAEAFASVETSSAHHRKNLGKEKCPIASLHVSLRPSASSALRC